MCTLYVRGMFVISFSSKIKSRVMCVLNDDDNDNNADDVSRVSITFYTHCIIQFKLIKYSENVQYITTHVAHCCA